MNASTNTSRLRRAGEGTPQARAAPPDALGYGVARSAHFLTFSAVSPASGESSVITWRSVHGKAKEALQSRT